MAKNKPTTELKLLMKTIPSENLSAFKAVYDDKKVWKPFMEVINGLIRSNDYKIVALVSDFDTDKAIKSMSKQNFYRGRTSAYVLVHGIMIHAGAELERREAQVKKNG